MLSREYGTGSRGAYRDSSFPHFPTFVARVCFTIQKNAPKPVNPWPKSPSPPTSSHPSISHTPRSGPNRTLRRRRAPRGGGATDLEPPRAGANATRARCARSNAVKVGGEGGGPIGGCCFVEMFKWIEKEGSHQECIGNHFYVVSIYLGITIAN